MKPSLDRRTIKRAATLAAALLVAAWLTLGDEAPAPKARVAAADSLERTDASAQRPAPRSAGGNAASVASLLGSAAIAAPSSTSSASASTVPQAARSDRSSAHQQALAALDTRLVQQRVGSVAGGLNAFAAKSWFVAPPPPPPPPPPAPAPEPPPPQAPPLPFKYMGMLQESPERTVWYLLQGERLVVAATGEQIDATYRIDGADGGQLRLTFLPLNQRQSLSIGVSP